MPVLNTASPAALTGAPKDLPSMRVPSERVRTMGGAGSARRREASFTICWALRLVPARVGDMLGATMPVAWRADSRLASTCIVVCRGVRCRSGARGLDLQK